MKIKQIFLAKGLSITVILILLLGLTACKKEANDENPASEDVNKYLVALPSWDLFCPPRLDTTELFDPSMDFSCQDLTVTTTIPASITRTPEDIVTFDPNSEILYVGSLIQGEGYLGGLGSLQALPIYQRAPLTISISFQMEDNSRIVQNPNLATVKEAIGALVQAAQNAGHVSGSSIFFNKSTSYSVEQTALALGLSAKFMKGSAKLDLDWEQNAEKQTVSAYFIQKMFTVSMVLPQRPGDLFSTEFTKGLLDEQISLGRIGPDNLPVYVSNVVYGRMMTLTMTSGYEEEQMKAALQASYNGIGGQISAEHLEILQNSEIQIVTIGGDANLALSMIKSGQLGDFFTSDSPLTTAVPISYTLRNLDNEIAKVSETVSYNVVQSGSVQVEMFIDENIWRSEIQGKGLADVKWPTTKENIYLANEASSFTTGQYDQVFMFNHITFSGSATGYPFDFYLEAKSFGNDYRALVHHDDNSAFTPTTISIGNFNNNEFCDDDFMIGVTGTAVYAIGFNMICNTATLPEEYLESIAEHEQCWLGRNTEFQSIYTGFVGVISPVPLNRIEFEESADDNDIGIQDFYFGYLAEK
jgi:hypothetical protein